MKTLTFTQAAREFETLAERTRDAAFDALQMAQEDVFERVLANSSGGASLALLRKADHPYARRHGRPKLAPDIINRQTGTFMASWKRGTITSLNGGLTADIFNTDPKAGYLEQLYPPPSKTRMFARPVDARSLAEALPTIERRFDFYLDRIWRH